jgi:5'-deoxynucleotidase YfbR-like HD superfamily hydrolase
MIELNLIQSFASIGRFSGSFLFCPENVPTHSVEMALLCINFSELAPESDKKEMVYRCVIHDFEESITSDIVRTIKHRNPKIKEEIDKVGFDLLKENSSEEFAKEVFTAKDVSDVNGFLVHIADRLQCFLKMSREVELFGNRSLKSDLETFKYSVYDLKKEVLGYEYLTIESRNRISDYINDLITNLKF